MKKVLVPVLIFAFIMMAGGIVQAGGKVFIDKINGFDAAMVNQASTELVNALQTKGYEVVTDKANADFLVTFNVITADADRSFNVAALFFFWLWPFVPFTTVSAEAVVSARVTDVNGQEVYSNQAGGTADGMWIFGDFASGSSLKKKALHQATQRVYINANF